ncbi:MAG TPA: metal ABC transporter permease [Acidimicrobiales bacterium]|nr:metal ABC transporter permease [Acidimicrobiales bacterium]
MFSGYMLNTWAAATMVAMVAGVVGFFVVLRGSAFVAHAIPHGAFGGAAGAYLLGVNTVYGLGAFAVAGAAGIGWLGRRGRHDVATALSLVMMLGLGAFFLSLSSEYSAEVFALLFGEVLGVARGDLLPIAALGAACLAVVAMVYRPLLLASVMPEVARARGLRTATLETVFLLVVAMATTMTVPVVGAFLMFSLTIGPAGAARSLTDSPPRAIGLSVAIALATVWTAIAVSYETNWPIGFFVGMFGVGVYGAARGWARRRRSAPAALTAG